MDAYSPRIERMMKRLYDSLAENDRRRYAAIESTKLGHVGVEYISRVLQCDPKTIRRGLAELEEGADLDTSRVRKKGGGRKPLIGQMTEHPERLDDSTSRTAWDILDRNRGSTQEFTMTKGIVTLLTAARSS